MGLLNDIETEPRIQWREALLKHCFGEDWWQGNVRILLLLDSKVIGYEEIKIVNNIGLRKIRVGHQQCSENNQIMQ